MSLSTKLKVYEIFKSIQGESSWQGYPCIFIRLAGCPLNCSWCDTLEVRTAQGTLESIDDIINRISVMGAKIVEVTGGEPLAQKETLDLLMELNEYGFTTLLETSGAFDIRDVHPLTHIIMDVKPPSSGEKNSLFKENFLHLTSKDEVKFPVGNREDFDYALTVLRKYEERSWKVLFTPIESMIKIQTLANWILEEAPGDSRFQIQLHKVIGFA